MNSKTLQIIASFETLAEAVSYAKIDLSYNKPLAESDMKHTQRNVRGAFVVAGERGDEVLYVYDAGDILLLNKYEPFFGCLNDSPFQLARVDFSEGMPEKINVFTVNMPKCEEVRQGMRKMQAGLRASTNGKPEHGAVYVCCEL